VSKKVKNAAPSLIVSYAFAPVLENAVTFLTRLVTNIGFGAAASSSSSVIVVLDHPSPVELLCTRRETVIIVPMVCLFGFFVFHAGT